VTPPPPGRRLILLDRDGVLNRRAAPHDYVRSEEDFAWLPGALQAGRMLSTLGHPLVVISNQRGIARGLFTHDDLMAIEARMRRDAAAAGWSFAAFYYCPHDVADRCDCRKPAPGLLVRAARDLDADLTRSVLIGDSESDIEAGTSVGCTTIRIGVAATETAADHTAESLLDAAQLLVHTAPAAGSRAGRAPATRLH
jgi:D-glycero-D-manno-heptose 1,7-bisphosphate phosphatase